MSPECCLKLERWQGPPHVKKVKQYEIVLSLKVSLLVQFFHSQKTKSVFIHFV